MAAPQLRGVSRALASAVLPQQGFYSFFSHNLPFPTGPIQDEEQHCTRATLETGSEIFLGKKVLQNPHTLFKALTAMAVDSNEDSLVIRII